MADRHGIDQLLDMIDQLAPAEVPAETADVPVAPVTRHSPTVRSAEERLEALVSGEALIKQFLYLREADYIGDWAAARETLVTGMLRRRGLAGEASPENPIEMKDGYTGERYTTTFQLMGGISVARSRVVVMRKQYVRSDKTGDFMGMESELLGFNARSSTDELAGLGLVPDKTIAKFVKYRQQLFEDL